MIVAVVGGGLSGAAIAQAVRARGAEPRLLSRATGFDVLHSDATAAFAGADAVIEATGYFTLSSSRARRFFVDSTTAVGTAAARLGLRHVLLSIVGCDLPDLQGYAIFAAKAAQERAARDLSADAVVVRSTQWFEFARQNAERFKAGPFVLVPAMSVQPIALYSVASVLADVALGHRSDPQIDIAGPRRTTLLQMTRQILQKTGIIPISVPLPGAYGAGFRSGRLLPDESADVHGPTFDAWSRS